MASFSKDEEENNMMKRPLLSSSNKGGLRTLPFILVNGALERLAGFGIMPNMILYLMSVYGMEMASASNVLFFWQAAGGFLPIFCAFLADSFVGRYSMTSFGIIINLMGLVLLWLTAMIPQLRPRCDGLSGGECESPGAGQLIFLILCFTFMSLGTGGIGASSLAFGADQLNNQRHFERYISWYYASSSVSVVVAMTCITYIQENLGWKIGFGVPMVLAFMAAVSFFVASSIYIKSKPKPGLLSELFQVAVASFRKRHLQLPENRRTDFSYYCNKDPVHVVPTDQLGFLNKACITRDPQQELTPDGIAADPWSLCTVDQVEDLKSVIRIVPLWASTMVVSINIGSFGTLQAKSMNRHVTSTFEIPAGSVTTIMVASLTLWLALYDRIIVPLTSLIHKRPVRLDGKQKIGVALAVSCLSMAVSAVVEKFRRDAAIREGIVDDPDSAASMSVMWVVPQNFLRGVVEAFMAVGQIEFYVAEFPRSMASVATNIAGLSMGMANLMSSALMNAVNAVTSSGEKESWVSGNINKGHYDYYYWVLGFLNLVNFLYFLVCCRAYSAAGGGDEGEAEVVRADE